ncbi:MAG: AP2 domain-containing protein [Methanotrichaceae archaeon]|jgi:hypothetical protein
MQQRKGGVAIPVLVPLVPPLKTKLPDDAAQPGHVPPPDLKLQEGEWNDESIDEDSIVIGGKVPGVSFNKRRNRWIARRTSGDRKSLGSFKTKDEAVEAITTDGESHGYLAEIDG